VFSTYGIHTTLQAIVDSRVGFVVLWVDFGPCLTIGAVAAGVFVCFDAEEVMEVLYAWYQGDLLATVVVTS